MFYFVLLGAMFGSITQSEEKLRKLGVNGWDLVDVMVFLSILLTPVFPAGIALLMRWEGNEPQTVEVVNTPQNAVPTDPVADDPTKGAAKKTT